MGIHEINNRVYAKLTQKYYFLAVFPAIFVLGAVVSVVLGIPHYDKIPSSEHRFFLLYPDNLLNLLFGSGFYLFYTAFFAWFCVRACRSDYEIIELDSDVTMTMSSGASKYSVLMEQTKKYVPLMLVWFAGFGWFFGDSLVDRLDSWVHMRISGHFAVLSSAALSLVLEVKYLQRVEKWDSDRTVDEVLKVLLLCLLGIWVLLFTVTAFFFHSVLEKFLGLALGAAVIFGVYYKEIRI